MIGQLISLFKARKDPAAAKLIASEMIIDGAIDRASWPLLIAKLWMGGAILVCFIITVLILLAANASHSAVAIAALPTSGLIYMIIRIWRGLNQGVETVSQYAKAELGARTAAIGMPSRRKDEANGENLNTP